MSEFIDGMATDAVILIVDACTPAYHRSSQKQLPPTLPIFLLDPQQRVSTSVNLLSPYQAYVTCIPTLVSLPMQVCGR